MEVRWEVDDDADEEGGSGEVEVAEEGTRWLAGGSTSLLFVTTDPAAPCSSFGPLPC